MGLARRNHTDLYRILWNYNPTLMEKNHWHDTFRCPSTAADPSSSLATTQNDENRRPLLTEQKISLDLNHCLQYDLSSKLRDFNSCSHLFHQ